MRMLTFSWPFTEVSIRTYATADIRLTDWTSSYFRDSCWKLRSPFVDKGLSGQDKEMAIGSRRFECIPDCFASGMYGFDRDSRKFPQLSYPIPSPTLPLPTPILVTNTWIQMTEKLDCEGTRLGHVEQALSIVTNCACVKLRTLRKLGNYSKIVSTWNSPKPHHASFHFPSNLACYLSSPVTSRANL